MKFFAIFIALLIAQQSCYSLPISDSDEELSDILDISEESSDSDDFEKVVPVDGKLVKEIVFDPVAESRKVLVFDNIPKGLKSNDKKKTGFVNIEKLSSDDSEEDDNEKAENSSESDSDSDSDEEENVKVVVSENKKEAESSSSEQDLIAVKEKKKIVKPLVEKAGKTDLKKAVKIVKPIDDLKAPVKDVKPIDDLEAPSRKINPAGQGSPYIKKRNRPDFVKKEDLAVKKVNEKKVETKPDVETPVRKINPAGQGAPYIKKKNQALVKKAASEENKKTEEKRSEVFRKLIEELKKEIQIEQAQGKSESSEEDDAEIGAKDDISNELIKTIQDLKEEIRMEKGLKKVESVEESEEDDNSSNESEVVEDSSEESEAASKKAVVGLKPQADAKKVESSSSEDDGIKNIKLTQTFDGKDETSSESSDSKAKTNEKDLSNVGDLVKFIEALKEEVKEERKEAEYDLVAKEESGELYMDESEESADKKLLSIFKELKKSEDLKDIKHFNDGKNTDVLDQQKPHLEIEKPENLNSEEVKIGFFISNENKDSVEEKKVDLMKDKIEAFGEIEIIPIFFDLPPFEFPANDMIQLIEIVEIPDKEASLKNNEIFGIEKKPDIANKNISDDIMSGGLLSKVKNIFSYVKKQYFS